jgi:serine-type D-Ala-D-Ala carboxypeptidase (penicillin-binding protein 5/6)
LLSIKDAWYTEIMRKWFTYFLGIILLTASVTLLLWTTTPVLAPRDGGFTSPLPDFLNVAKNRQVRLLDLWAPKIEQTSGSTGPVANITARSVLIYDLSTGETIYERNPKQKLPMASLTKIMTAIIALENPAIDNKYTVPKEAIVGEDSMGLEDGETLGRTELLYGLLLPSGNDAAEVFGANYPGGRGAFIRAMNEKAKALGALDTNFTNPSGLEGDGDQHTTAYDLLIMTRYALEMYPQFVEIVASPEHDIPGTASHKAYTLYNETNLITTYPGVKGVKTGYTPEAGMCLVTYLDYKGHRIIGILLNSENRRQEMKDLLDYSLKKLGTEPPHHN